jgi:hypothetical protein
VRESADIVEPSSLSISCVKPDPEKQRKKIITAAAVFAEVLFFFFFLIKGIESG